jgi:general secretion pathway protein A
VEELLREVLLDFGVVSRQGVRSGRISTASKHELISTLHDFLLSLMTIRGSAVLIIDEAQHLSPQVLEQIRIISNLETNESKLLQIVLVGQLNLLDVLAAAEMRQLDQRISIRAALKPLNREESKPILPIGSGWRAGPRRSPSNPPHSITCTASPAACRASSTSVRSVPDAIGADACQPGHAAIIDDAAASLGLRLPAARPKASVESSRWKITGIAAAVVALIVAGAMWLAPLDRLIDVVVPPLPAPPAYQSRYPYGAKPIPQADLLLPPAPTPPPVALDEDPSSPRFSRN